MENETERGLKYSINGNEEQKPKILVKEILQAASGTNYSKLLDLLDCNKWQTLKISNQCENQYILSSWIILSG